MHRRHDWTTEDLDLVEQMARLGAGVVLVLSSLPQSAHAISVRRSWLVLTTAGDQQIALISVERPALAAVNNVRQGG